MILQSLAELAGREGLLENPDYEPKPVAWIIAVDRDGRFLGLTPTVSEGEGGKKAKAKVFAIPRVSRTPNNAAGFLVDHSEYVLGVKPGGGRSEQELRARRTLFRDGVRDALTAKHLPALAAVLAFLDSDAERAQAAERLADEGYVPGERLAFEYGGDLVHELPDAREYFSEKRRPGGEGRMQCLVCGARCVPVDPHPLLKLRGGTPSGVALVSFNEKAFESYGLKGNENAPVCRDCADAYTTALKRLLGDGYPGLPKRWVSLSPDTTAVFWADRETPLLDFFSNCFDSPGVESVRALLESPYKGRQAAAAPERFCCLVLSGGKGRAVLRGMHTGTVAQVHENLRRYFESIDVGAEQPMPLKWLLRTLALQGKNRDPLENLPSGLAAEVFLAIVFGGPFPRTVLARAVERCRAERKVARERAAVVKAYLIRNEKLEVNVGLDRDNAKPGYRLGRLIAVLERVQGAAQKSQTIVERYYGAASTRPATVFPRLVGLAQHHLAKLKEGLAVHYQRLLGEVMDGLSEFPSTLNLEEQGLFALGYYHQRQDFYKKHEDEPEQPAEAEGASA